MDDRREPLETGQIVGGKYAVEDRLSAGAFAVVFSAERLADRMPVAIKALKFNVTTSDPAAVDRFIREAAIATHLYHPNLVRIFDFGRTRDDVLYIVMERLHGQLLASVIHKDPMVPGRVTNVLRQMLDALVVAHGQGLVHRDLKPSNVFLCRVDQAHDAEPVDWVKILDFGFAKGIDRTAQNVTTRTILRATLTMDGTRVGTPGYMAPEMFDKKTKLSPQMDLYSVGLLGHEMLTGEQAYPGHGMERALLQLRSDPTEPPSFISEHPLYEIIRKLIARDRRKRYRSAEMALRDLDALGRTRGKIWM